MNKLLSLFCASSLWFATPSQAGEKEAMLRDLGTLEGILEAGYAPMEWKKEFKGWNLPYAMEQARMRVREMEEPSVDAFQKVVGRFFKEIGDYHTTIGFYRTEKASLPLVIRSAEGRYFIVAINRAKLGWESFPFNEGDELLAFDGRPIEEAIGELKCFITQGQPLKQQRDAESCLTVRRAAIGFPVPRGTVALTILPRGEERSSDVQLIWDYHPEEVCDPQFVTRSAHPFPFADMEAPSWQDEEADHPFASGSRTSYLPRLGPVLWESDEGSTFDAYLFRGDEGDLFGYLRIARYRGGEVEIEELAEILRYFQSNAAAVVIDQLGNPGGSWFYYSTILSMLSDRPLVPPMRRFALNQAVIDDALGTLRSFEQVASDEEAVELFGGRYLAGYPVTLQMCQFGVEFARFLLAEWGAGKRLTDPTPIWGMHWIHPSQRVQLTKPLLFLIDETDTSAGDFVPAVLQDSGRGLLMGQRTAGAGGHVVRASFPNQWGVEWVSFTGSLAIRPSGSPIEDLGVTPDLAYEWTVADLQEGFHSYRDAICEQLALLAIEGQ